MTSDKFPKVPPIIGALEPLEAMKNAALGKRRPERYAVFREDIGTHVVDTCVGFDTGIWETAVSPNHGATWVIVEQYHDRQTAQKGHLKWVEKLIATPEQELVDVDPL